MQLLQGRGIDLSQARWAYNTYVCGDEYDAFSRTDGDGLAVDAHGYCKDGRWVMNLDGTQDVQEWVLGRPENYIFLNVCNPAGVEITARPGQTVVYARSTITGSGGSAAWTETKGDGK